MLNRNRQPYINKQANENTQPKVLVNSNSDEISAMIVDTLKLLSKNVESIQKAINSLEERFEYLDARQRKLEDQINRYSSISNYTESDLSSLRNELKILKQGKEKPNTPREFNDNEAPIMQGTGFASITPGYLKSLQNR